MCVKFYFGQNEDCSLGDCTSESSEKLLQRDRWRKVSIYMILVKGEIHAVKHMFFQKVPASLMKLLLVTRNSGHHEGFSAFVDMRRYKNWAHKIGS